MRFVMIASVTGFVMCGALPAMAQNYYNTTTSTTGQTQARTAVPFYNTTAAPLPMEQMVAGKNAPSYNFNGGVKPYNLNQANGQNSSGGPLTAEQVNQIRAQRDARAQQYEQEYMQQMADAAPQGAVAAATNGYNNLMQPQEKPKPTKKRLVRRDSDNPLAAPPRLFNPDQ